MSAMVRLANWDPIITTRCAAVVQSNKVYLWQEALLISTRLAMRKTKNIR